MGDEDVMADEIVEETNETGEAVSAEGADVVEADAASAANDAPDTSRTPPAAEAAGDDAEAPAPEKTPKAKKAPKAAAAPAGPRVPAPPPRLREVYQTEIRPLLQEEFKYSSSMQHPRITKITLNMGVGEAKQNAKALDQAVDQLSTIAGQRPAITKARKSIAQFKLREGMAIGCKVTLRGARMWEFYDRLTSIALPRIRDFRGVNPDGFDGRGNYNLGLREQTIFPEIDYDSIDNVRGLNVTITTTAETDEEGRALLRHLGMPFRPEGYTAEERAVRRRQKMRKHGRGRR